MWGVTDAMEKQGSDFMFYLKQQLFVGQVFDFSFDLNLQAETLRVTNM